MYLGRQVAASECTASTSCPRQTIHQFPKILPLFVTASMGPRSSFQTTSTWPKRPHTHRHPRNSQSMTRIVLLSSQPPLQRSLDHRKSSGMLTLVSFSLVCSSSHHKDVTLILSLQCPSAPTPPLRASETVLLEPYGSVTGIRLFRHPSTSHPCNKELGRNRNGKESVLSL